MKALYVRVSTVDQNPGRQKTKAKGYTVFEDKCSGSVPFAERPAGKRVLEALEAGKLEGLEVHTLDRLGRDLPDILDTIGRFNTALVPIHLREQALTTLNANGEENKVTKMVLSMLGAVAEMEQAQRLERQLEGIALAKAQGKYLGRKPGTTESLERFLSKARTQKILKLLDRGLTGAEIQRVIGCSPNTVSKVRRLTRLVEKEARKGA